MYLGSWLNTPEYIYSVPKSKKVDYLRRHLSIVSIIYTGKPAIIRFFRYKYMPILRIGEAIAFHEPLATRGKRVGRHIT